MEIIEIEGKRRDGTSFKERKTDTGKAYYEMGRWEDPDVRGYHDLKFLRNMENI